MPKIQENLPMPKIQSIEHLEDENNELWVENERLVETLQECENELNELRPQAKHINCLLEDLNEFLGYLNDEERKEQTVLTGNVYRVLRWNVDDCLRRMR